MLSILDAVGHSSTRNIIIAIGIVTLCFGVISLVMLIGHLQRNKDEIYAEELKHLNPDCGDLFLDVVEDESSVPETHCTHAKQSPIVKLFDILFIMVLCFVTLFAAMLVRGKTVNDSHIYTFGIWSALVTVVGFIVYFVSVIKSSNKELKMMIDELYTINEDSQDEVR